jgi:hypothetical protein
MAEHTNEQADDIAARAALKIYWGQFCATVD